MQMFFQILTFGLPGNDYRVATLFKSYLTVTGIIMQNLKSIGATRYVRTYGQDDHNYRKALL